MQWLESSSDILEYNFIPEERKFLNIKEKKCVEDNLYGIYHEHIKKITIEYIRNLASEYYKNDWTYEKGYTTNFIKYFCENHNISMYAFDITNKCFLKHVTKSHRKYPALFFYALNGHMYLVKNEEKCKKMMEQAKDHENFNTSIVELKEKENIFNSFKDYNEETKQTTYRIEENIRPEDILNYESRIFMYSNPSRNNINDIFYKCIELYGIPSTKSIVSDKTNITRFEYILNNQLYIFVVDPNDAIHVNYKMVLHFCLKNNVEFKNQTFPSFIRELKDIHIKNKSKREEIDILIKDKLKLKQNNKCANCEELLTDYECDHIRPLANGGTNELSNLQILCKSCHIEKCKFENEDGSYVRIIDTESSFNNQTSEIIHSNLNKHLAFVEKMSDPPEKFIKIDQNEIIINKAKASYFKELKNTTNMTDEEINEFIGRCDFSNFKCKVKKYKNVEYIIFTIDINKCRKNILFYSKHNYPVFTCMDEIKQFNKDNYKKCGWFYVETKQFFPLHGNGWYSYPLIEYCLQEKLINHDEIKLMLQPSIELQHDYFNSFINECYNNSSLEFTNEKLFQIYNEMETNLDIIDPKKLAINSMIGGFKPSMDKNIKWKSLCITSKSTEAYEFYLKNKGCFIKTIKTDNNIYYHVFKEFVKSNIETEQPIYDQILDIEAMELHKLSTIIKNNGGQVLDLKTDAITCIFKDNKFPFKLIDEKNLKGFYWDDNKKVPKYKIEESKRLIVERSSKLIRNETYELKKQEVKYYKDVEDNNFEPLINTIINSDESFNIDGAGGCGKSHLINDLKKKLDELKKTYTVLTPTNLSALIVKGKTIHKFVSKIKKMESIYNLNYDYIFVDEISMVKECFYKFLLTIKRIKPNIKFIISGDIKRQFLPINDRADFDYEHSIALKELTDYNTLTLSKCRRSDDKLYKLCDFKNIMNVDKSQFNNKMAKKHICFTNKKRIEINEMCMLRYRPQRNYVTLSKNKLNCQSQEMYIYNGLPVICKVTDEKQSLNNNEQFIITQFDNDFISIKSTIDDRILDIDTKKFNKIFLPAYAITIYSSQGCTINEPYTIHEFEKLNRRARFVALSRSSKMEYINII